MKVISGFFGEYRFLSNMHGARVPIRDGDATFLYPSAETAYQAQKLESRTSRLVMAQYPGPTAKELSRSSGFRMGMTRNWYFLKLSAMRKVVTAKFDHNTELREKLFATEDAELVEENWWGDTFWGICNGRGRNHLGKILMEIRTELRIKYAR